MLVTSLTRFSLALVAFFLAHTVAQSFPQTKGWQDPSISLSYEDRVSLAETSLDLTFGHVALGFGNGQTRDIPFSAAILYASSEFDRRSRQFMFRDRIIANLTEFQQKGNFTSITRLLFGLAYLSAYQAYPASPQANGFLSTAEMLWTTSQRSFVTQAAATDGSLSGLVRTFNPTCVPLSGGSPTSTAGAVSVNETVRADGETVGLWITLSAQLHNATNKATYLDPAATSINFAKSFLSNGTTVFDTYNFSSCSLTNESIYTRNGGYFLKGLSAYYSRNTSAITSEVTEYVSELAASLILYPGWTQSDSGINIEGAFTTQGEDSTNADYVADWKAILVEGLYQCLETSLLNTSVSDLAQQYISVQYNAVRNLASFQNSQTPSIQYYGPSWNGSLSNLTNPDWYGQQAANELFVTALGIGPVATHSQNRTRTGAIVGGVVGGVALVVGVFLAVFFWRRRKRTSAVDLIEDSPHRTNFGAEPFVATEEEYPLSERDRGLSKRRHTPRVPAPSSEGGSATSERGLVEQSRDGGSEGLVPVDASALQRLLLSVGGALSDLQHRGSGEGGSSIAHEPPPNYEEGETHQSSPEPRIV
ncbi:unnamed protein product [Peniophora sp. CBMAI 1063]|nr:unnamed protein product [Peniophora sp. CBMAI 1063]